MLKIRTQITEKENVVGSARTTINNEPPKSLYERLGGQKVIDQMVEVMYEKIF